LGYVWEFWREGENFVENEKEERRIQNLRIRENKKCIGRRL
jgi:hypothetical protein